jgi:hypothetical protein
MQVPMQGKARPGKCLDKVRQCMANALTKQGKCRGMACGGKESAYVRQG